MARYSKEITESAKKAARTEIELVINKKGYMTREELGKKYNIHPQRIWRFIKKYGLKYDPELRRIREYDFLKWMKENPHMGDRRFKSK